MLLQVGLAKDNQVGLTAPGDGTSRCRHLSPTRHCLLWRRGAGGGARRCLKSVSLTCATQVRDSPIHTVGQKCKYQGNKRSLCVTPRVKMSKDCQVFTPQIQEKLVRRSGCTREVLLALAETGSTSDLRFCLRVDPPRREELGEALIRAASHGGRRRAAELLIEAGADPMATAAKVQFLHFLSLA